MARSLLLLLLIAVAVTGGLVWFDYLNVIDIKTTLAPVYRFIGLEGRSQAASGPDETLNLDAERLAVRLEALELRSLEIEKQAQSLSGREAELAQIASELEDKQKGLDERERTMDASDDLNAVKNRGIERIARQLNNMPPQNAVGTINEMDDQLAIDVLLKSEELAQASGAASIVPFWLSLMQPQRAADLQRKMAERPN